MVTITAFVGAIFVVIGLALWAFVIQLTDGRGEPRFRGY
jgi:hypothetical protein